MKYLTLMACLFVFSASAFAQKIVHLTPQQLIDSSKASGRPAIIQFWIPNCAASKEIVIKYKQLQEEYGTEADFYFIGITNKDSLVSNLVSATGYNHKIYVADAAVAEDLMDRRSVFCNEVCRLLGTKEKDFITLYLDKNNTPIYIGDDLEIKPKKIKKLLKAK
jgi:thiol-disulfide isomerase/thioredoxin